ncbi:MAG: hypothetical protein JWM99_1112 [Verrucomicrobiales bacterium]|nr:hypothetical protein [Verrucomicrobiales bacterium]
MIPDRFQHQRFELKYVISESLALCIREFVSGYLELDEFGATMPNYSYPVHSLYLDSRDLRTYRSTVSGDKNRFKLRLRYYDDSPETPIFFEIKRRMNTTILKERGGVKRASVKTLLAGQLPCVDDLVSNRPSHMAGLQRFAHLMTALNAEPKVHVAYLREAWISRHDNSIRVTLDRHVQCDLDPTARLDTQSVNPVVVFNGLVILELKFTNRFPDWFNHLVATFGLAQAGAAKYVGGVELLGEQRVSRANSFQSQYSGLVTALDPKSRSHIQPSTIQSLPALAPAT